MFVASTIPDRGRISAHGSRLRDGAGNPLPNVSTNIGVHIPKVELTEMWEKDDRCDKIPHSKAGPPHNLPANRLFVSTEASGKAELHIKTEITPLVTGIGSHIVWGVLDGATLLPESGTLDDNGEADVIFATTGDHKVYTIRVGCDKNGDGKLQMDEIIQTPAPPTKPFTVLVVTQNDYARELNSLRVKKPFGAGVFPIASSLLTTFLTEGLPPDGSVVPPSTVALSSSHPDLTHVAGAIFPFPGCTANIKHHIFADGSRTSNRVEKSNTIDAQECLFLISKKTEIETFFATTPDKSHQFTWEWKQRFQDADGTAFVNHDDLDLHFAFGDVEFSATVTALIDRNLKIKSVKTTGGFTDLYDFNYEAGGLNTQAATLQLGWKAILINRAGGIFETEVVIDSDLNKWGNILRK